MKLNAKETIKLEDELIAYAGVDRIVTSKELITELNETDESVFKIPTGVPSLDRMLDGVEAGELVIVTGPTGEGKTTLLMSITANMAAASIESLWFTLEVTPRQFLKKLTKGMGEHTPLFYIPRAGFDDVDPEFIEKYAQEHKRPFQMIDWVEYKILEAKFKAEAKGGVVKAIFIDHIHSIFSVAKVERNISLEIGDMVARVKQIALNNNLVIFLIAHNKDPQDGVRREPKKEDIRDSGMISRLADTIIGVWRVPNDEEIDNVRRKEIGENDTKTKLRIFKNRREGKQGAFFMYHNDHKLTEDAFAGSNF